MLRTVTIDNQLSVTVPFGEVNVKGLEASIETIQILKFLAKVEMLVKCPGIPDNRDVKLKTTQGYRFITTSMVNGKPVTKSTIRAHDCVGGIGGCTVMCDACTKLCKILEKQMNQIQFGDTSTMLNPKIPLKHVRQQVLIREVKAAREENKRLQGLVDSLNKGESVTVADDVGEGLFASMQSCKSNNSLMNLSWEEQNPRGMRWHPMMIRFAIFLQYQSARAYEALRESGVLRLPNKSTRRDNTNFVQPHSGFQNQAFEELKKIADKLPAEKKYVALLHDEIKVKADLVYDRRSQQVIGFTNPDTWSFNEDETRRIASHVLVFMVVGINSHIKMSVCHFPTRSSTADELYPLLWKAIAYLELACGLKVISSTSDKASPNQRLYRLHKIGNEPVVYRADNPYSQEKRFVYFFSDVPHLIKTTRNNIHKSRPGGTKYLWNNNTHILWSHVEKLYKVDAKGQLYRTKLKNDHIYLTPSSTMSVRLAAQVLSSSVSKVMSGFYGPEMSETARFFLLVDRFFDHCMRPSTYANQTWRHTKAKTIQVNAFIEATRYLFQQGVPYVLSQNFCKDPLEEHFGRHRGLCARHDNPTVHQFSYQENQLRLQRNLAMNFTPKGNTGGRNGDKRPVTITNSPVKRIRRN